MRVKNNETGGTMLQLSGATLAWLRWRLCVWNYTDPTEQNLGYQRSAFLLSGKHDMQFRLHYHGVWCTCQSLAGRREWGHQVAFILPNVSDSVAETFFLLWCFTLFVYKAFNRRKTLLLCRTWKRYDIYVYIYIYIDIDIYKNEMN